MITQLESNNYALDNLLPELSLIKDLQTRNSTTQVILSTPGLFWYRASAFYKGHHPDDELGDWGNLLHVKRVVLVGKVLAVSENLGNDESSAFFSSLTLHDIGKYGVDGEQERIQKDHPELGKRIILAYLGREASSIEESMVSIVLTHMGRWGKVRPVTQLEKLGHYCDAIASRADISIPVKLK